MYRDAPYIIGYDEEDNPIWVFPNDIDEDELIEEIEAWLEDR